MARARRRNVRPENGDTATPAPKAPGTGAAVAGTTGPTGGGRDTDALLALLGTDGQGLTGDEAARRLAATGPNSIADERTRALAELATFFWGPIPWMIEVADLLSGILRHWDDVAIVSILLLFNAAVGPP